MHIEIGTALFGHETEWIFALLGKEPLPWASLDLHTSPDHFLFSHPTVDGGVFQQEVALHWSALEAVRTWERMQERGPEDLARAIMGFEDGARYVFLRLGAMTATDPCGPYRQPAERPQEQYPFHVARGRSGQYALVEVLTVGQYADAERAFYYWLLRSHPFPMLASSVLGQVRGELGSTAKSTVLEWKRDQITGATVRYCSPQFLDAIVLALQGVLQGRAQVCLLTRDQAEDLVDKTGSGTDALVDGHGTWLTTCVPGLWRKD